MIVSIVASPPFVTLYLQPRLGLIYSIQLIHQWCEAKNKHFTWRRLIMKFKILLVSILCLLSIGFAYQVFTKPTNTNASIEVSVSDKLTKLFGNEASNLQQLEKYTEKGKEITEYKGKNISVALSDGKIVKYLKSNLSLKGSQLVNVEESQAKAIDFVKKIDPDVNLNQFTYKHEVSNRGQGDFNQFSWSVNQNDLETTSIAVWSTMNGDVFGYVYSNQVQPDIPLKITKEQATSIVKDNLKQKQSVNIDKIEIKRVSKMVSNDNVYWYVEVYFPAATPGGIESGNGYYVNANTGEVNIQ
jgi:hypothetical protein